MKTIRKIAICTVTLIAAMNVTGCSYASKADLEKTQRVSDQALNTANEARDIAQEANDRSKRLEEMMNRSFKKSMYK